VIPAIRGGIGGLRPASAKMLNLAEKYLKQKRVGGVAQGVELLPSKHEALSSNSGTTLKTQATLC
jgi:hypothetical protein